MSEINFEFRINCAFRYHLTLVKSQNLDWLDLFEILENNSKSSVPEYLTLLHPKWHSKLGINSNADPRGNSSFNAVFRQAKCRSEKIWGYPCPYIDLKIHVDHTFPYSRGGSTTAENAMYLCKEHNLSKNTDIHLIPWEDFNSQNWIKLQLKFFINIAQRLTNEKLYFPDKKLHLQ